MDHHRPDSSGRAGGQRAPQGRLLQILALIGVAALLLSLAPFSPTTPETLSAQPRASTTPAQPSSRAPARRTLPPNQPARGLIYDGLEVADEGACRGMFRVKLTGQCTHGPDPLPPGVSHRRNVPRVAPAVSRAEADRSAALAASLDAGTAPASTAAASAALVGQAICDGDGVTGRRTQVIYARASDMPDRYAEYLMSFQQWVLNMDQIYLQSAAETGGQRYVRFVHDASCTPTVLNVVLSPTGDDNFGTMASELQALGYTRADRKYLIFVDAFVGVCGEANMQGDDQPGQANRNNGGPHYARVDTSCWGEHTAAHELMHNMGGVQITAPHNTRGGGHCYDEYDVMCYQDSSWSPPMQYLCPDFANEYRFDCNHDDYYHTSPPAGSYLSTHWNAANSLFLIPPSSNDQFASRRTLSGAAPLVATGATIWATKEAGEPSHAGNAGGRSIWWSWTAPASGSVAITTHGSSFNTLLAVYTGSAVGSLTLVASNNDDALSGKTTSRVAISAVAGTTYQIAVDGAGGASGTVVLNFTPANDTFASRKTIAPGATGLVEKTTNMGAAKEAGEPSHAGNAGGSSLWWSWTAPASGQMRIVVRQPIEYGLDTLLAVYTGSSVGALTLVASNDDVPGGENILARWSEVTFQAVAGTTYQIAADSRDGVWGEMWLYFPPANDSFASRAALTTPFAASGLTLLASGSTLAGSSEPGEPVHTSPGAHSIWWSWTAPSSGLVTFYTGHSPTEHMIKLYEGTSVSALAQVWPTNDFMASNEVTRFTFYASAGATYQIAVEAGWTLGGDVVLYGGYGYIVTSINDGYARDGIYADTVHGNPTMLEVKTGPVDENRDTYLSFDISEISTIARARLRIYAALETAGSVSLGTYAVADSSWYQWGLTWNTRPPLGAQLTTTTVSGSAFGWYEIDLTGYIQSERNAGLIQTSVGFHVPVASAPLLRIAPSSARATRAELVILDTLPVVTPTSTRTATRTPTRTVTRTSTSTPTPAGACPSTNLALGRPATSSADESVELGPGKAVDGNAGTRWSSAWSDPQWLQVDLGSVQTICRVQLHWEAAYARAYQLQISNDASSWTTIYSTTAGDGAIDDLAGLSHSGRYVRVYGTARATPYGYSLWEVEVYGGQPPTFTPTVTRTSTRTVTRTATATHTATRSATPTGATATVTRTSTRTVTRTSTRTVTRTSTRGATPTVTAGPLGNTLYVIDGATTSVVGALALAPGAAANSDTIASAGGVNRDGTPASQLTYLATGITRTYDATRSTQFTFWVDSGASVGNAVQARVSYDFTGDGTWDRVETYGYFASDPVAGWEQYTQSAGLRSASGTYANLSNGRLRIELWSALGSASSTVRTSATTMDGQLSTLGIPFS